ncbi:tetratricopeptide repeat-containing sulfotransferase family protein [Methylomagnum sp.]
MTDPSPMQRGHAAIQSRHFPEAAAWFERAVAENPKDGQAKACLGQTLCWLGRRGEGIGWLRQAGQLLLKKGRKRGEVGDAIQLARQLQFWDDHPGALELARQAAQVTKTDARVFQVLATSHARLHQNQSALAAGRQALRLVPDHAALNTLVAGLEAGEGRPESAIRRLEKVLRDFTSPEDKFRAHKELAKILDKTGQCERVFAHLRAAADLAPRLPEIARQDAALVPRMIETYRAGFDRELLGRWSGAEFPADAPAPVFVMGFMRSGTTLTQEVLDVSPGVFVADESGLMAAVFEELGRLPGLAGTPPERLRAIDAAGVRHLRRFYWRKARERYGEALAGRALVDKTTMNTIDLGLINAIFPDAKVVFVLRDPRDVCLSCFMQTMLPTPSTVHLLDWRRTADFYGQVMGWWMEFKGRTTLDFIEFRYEDAVAAFEPTFRQVFDFLGLAWDAAALDFHRHAAGKFIASPSAGQVVQPLYDSSVGRWRRYGAEFEGVAETLRPFVSAFGYPP